jgi:hypothetical protein
VPLGGGAGAARGTSSEIGSGVYSVGWDDETSAAVWKLLAGVQDKGTVEDIWQYTESELQWTTE